ncbi:unnamed protein product [Callosobruchus maculatus]|uniref:AAA+ ATPase domain-containing protein n=1 Tax=Callosobruchus maculatus TaxID=64391 RepID=A0A653BS69_CALMS|nr:unnamed protein product [Callosobruchus maculatus]
MKRILITGLPGVGKTTLIKKIASKLNSEGITCNGFYTEEIRQNNIRIGFDIVTLDGNRAPLARKSLPTSDQRLPRVGQYVVYIDEFEKLALPLIENPPSCGLLIIDEIGKMELLSKKFMKAIMTIIENKSVKVMATVPEKSNCSLVQQLKQDKEFELITLTARNRNDLEEVILKNLV